ncbi:hypothetical protein PISMIDRAFT_687894 [Pisolithus microcarpus 441]|uniref:Uncharacterized protein n=1 Tax=Pisolithus microcarpus 441 TaxID=765257 RepID=A0A0C9Z3F2_9AGAM|nr:hypothetical protein BKA83DRAFT_687894 [Pisolithus microcarpus]KIK14528.1 hypothetical protein PISMIDRAFT_687894 [Pisolithus microcarpus 441]
MQEEILAAWTASEKKKPPAYANPLKELYSGSTDQLTSAVARCRVISIFSSSAERQLEDAAPEDRDPKQPKVWALCS